MTTTSNTAIYSTEREMREMGFKGKALQDLVTLVTDQEGIEELESFIINSEGKFKCNVSLVCAFRRKKLLESPVDKVSFIYGYQLNGTMLGKVSHLQDLLKCCVSEEDVVRFDNGLRSGDFTSEDFYEAFINDPLLPVKRLCVEAKFESNKSTQIPEPTDW